MARILVVEDEETLAEAISFHLSREGFDVAIAATGPDAIESFDKSNGLCINSVRFLHIKYYEQEFLISHSRKTSPKYDQVTESLRQASNY